MNLFKKIFSKKEEIKVTKIIKTDYEIRVDKIHNWYLQKGINPKYLIFVDSMGDFCSCNEYCLTPMAQYAEFGIDLTLFDYKIVFGKRTLTPLEKIF